MELTPHVLMGVCLSVQAAAKVVQCRILLQSGWTKYAEDNTLVSDEVMVIGAMVSCQIMIYCSTDI